MALRLRRGTESERQNLVSPLLEGELIYVTDTGKLYIGNGTATGGVEVIGSGGGGGGGATTLDALTDTDLLGLSDGDVLTYIGASNKWEPVPIPGVSAISMNQLSDVDFSNVNALDILIYDGFNFIPIPVQTIFAEQQNWRVNIVGDDSTILVDTDTNSFRGLLFGDVQGDVKGSVFGDDSTLLVDGTDGKIVGNVETNQLVVKNPYEIVAEFKSLSGEDISFIDVNVNNGTFDSPTTLTAGDSGGGIRSKSWDGSQYKMNMAIGSVHTDSANFADDYPAADTYLITAGGSETVLWNFKSDKTLVAPGPIQPGVYADNTARDAAIPSPTAGMMVFNSTGTKFQGYTGSAWVDLN